MDVGVEEKGRTNRSRRSDGGQLVRPVQEPLDRRARRRAGVDLRQHRRPPRAPWRPAVFAVQCQARRRHSHDLRRWFRIRQGQAGAGHLPLSATGLHYSEREVCLQLQVLPCAKAPGQDQVRRGSAGLGQRRHEKPRPRRYLDHVGRLAYAGGRGAEGRTAGEAHQERAGRPRRPYRRICLRDRRLLGTAERSRRRRSQVQHRDAGPGHL